jgi:hypothetical protein
MGKRHNEKLLGGNGEWRLVNTGLKQERYIPIQNLEIHPKYPYDIDTFTEEDISNAMTYIGREAAPYHRLYVMPNPKRPGFYFIIGWLIVYEAYKRQKFNGWIPTLCYLESHAPNILWNNWRNCPGEFIDIK